MSFMCLCSRGLIKNESTKTMNKSVCVAGCLCVRRKCLDIKLTKDH